MIKGTRIKYLTWLTLACLPVSSLWAQKADLTQMIVLGEGLSAGFADFQLREVYQTNSFPALVAKQAKVLFLQPLIQAPGLGWVPGFPTLPALVPNTLQDTVRVPAAAAVTTRPKAQPQQNLFIFNVSIPNATVSDVLRRRAALPLIQQDVQQTTVNMILGFPGLATGPNKPGWTQLEYAELMRPTFAIISLGYSDVLPAAAVGDPSLLPSLSAFKADYATIMAGMKTTFAQTLVVNIPDPVDTAYYSTLTAASRLLLASPAQLASLYNLKADDQITIPGLTAMGTQIANGRIGPLPAGSIVSAASVTAIRNAVSVLNTEIASQAQASGYQVYDVRALFASLKNTTYYAATGQALTADYLGGLYSLSGFYPGSTVQAMIANDIITLINKSYGGAIPTLSVDAVLAQDPAARVFYNRTRPRPVNGGGNR